ncbi:Cysteine-rich secretory protein family protein [uncultured archaeon]|nr:Cysteine-rich secretory protein family protein [uncultured archaeon]
MKKAYRRNSLRIAYGITMLVLLLTGSASALYDSEAQYFLGLINNYRAQNNLGKLIVDAKLQESANWMSNDMLPNCVNGKYTCSHTDSTGRTFVQRLRDFGYPAGLSASAAENIAWGYGGGASSAQQAFDLWKNSQGHRTNMLDSSFVAIGISRSCSAGDCAWVTDFGSMIVKPLNNDPTPTGAPKTGDINGNGKLTLLDAIYLAKHVGGFSGYEIIYADGDINANGIVTHVDAIYLAKHVGGFIGYETIY